MPAQSSPASRRPIAPTMPKLRDSCHTCASSKLRCSKEKPTCSRCAKRGIICEYVATKRGGNKHGGQSRRSNSGDVAPGATAIANNTQLLTPISGQSVTHSTTSSVDSIPQPNKDQSPKPSSFDASSNLFSSFLSPLGQSLSTGTMDQMIGLNDFPGSPVSFSLPDISDVDFLNQAPANHLDTFPIFEDAVSEIFALTNQRSPTNGHASPISDTQSNQDSQTNNSACICLTSALSLMKQLFPSSSATCIASTMQGFENHPSLPTIQTVIAKNEHTIEAISAMLQCSCSQDGYLLTILSLIVFKVLGWYAAAARITPSPGDALTRDHNNDRSMPGPQISHARQSSYPEQVLPDPAIIGSYCLKGEDSARMAAQLVLSELHRVQRLINQLSGELKIQAAKASKTREVQANGDGIEDSANGEPILPLSAVMLSQLETDLRRRLRELSLGIAEDLKRE